MVVTSGSTKLLKALEIMTNIACNVISEAILKGIDGINDEDDEQMFHEIRLLYISNNQSARDFAQHINETILFPEEEDDYKYNSYNSEDTLIYKQFEQKIK